VCNDRLEIGAPLGELIDLGACGRRQFPSAHDAGFRHLTQTLGQDVRAGPWHARAQVGKPFRAEQQFPHDQQRPSLANEVE
jgi:hypothetical protein